MTHADGSAPADRLGAPDPHRAPGRRVGTTALWLGIAALVVAAALVPFFPGFGLLAVLVLAALAGLAALVLGIRARRIGAGGGVARWALALGIIGIVLDVVIIAVLAVGALAHLRRADVEVRAQGAPTFSVTYADDSQSYTEDWLGSGWKRFTTTKSTAEITVTLPKDAPSTTLSCQILWNGTVVVDEKSDSGSVTCRYGAR
ncbi:hypothetical protein [Microbacterium panaciterrae]|uniref:DUF4190 domain-containing protein n=1 Tax=Microbacterium panaciterrae TaxID=985759 RepID=A0ABP8PA73_9MICO